MVLYILSLREITDFPGIYVYSTGFLGQQLNETQTDAFGSSCNYEISHLSRPGG